MRFEDGIKDKAGISIALVVREVGDRENWRRFCRDTATERPNDLTVS